MSRSATPIQTLPGFRDFFPRECAARNYLFEVWRKMCRRYGFQEYEGPILEATDLYRKKSGDEVVEQLFAFQDKGERDVTLRPELTPTLARMVIARQREFKKPLRWFSIGPFFRFERPQVAKGRLREFYQFNCDLLGEESPNADAELISLAIDIMTDLGFAQEDFMVKLSDRDAWLGFLDQEKLPRDHADAFLQIIDKMEREKPEVTESKLNALGTSVEAVRAFIDSGAETSPKLTQVLETLRAQGKDTFCQLDLGIVRGLAYYTGVVFELFDRKHGLRAIAGGGRYDRLVETISDGKTSVPACGFAMGDVVIGNLIPKCSEAKQRYLTYESQVFAVDVFVVVASEARRAMALEGVQKLRDAGWRVHFPYSPTKVGKQFQSAEMFQAAAAVVYGDEFPTITIKNLTNRSETTVSGQAAMLEAVKALIEDPYPGGLYA